jgi:sugar O-acyltransferase (sialic acid O-acetyltransferase NeuD family)
VPAKPQSVVVIGGGGHATVVMAVLVRLPEFHTLGYVDPRDCGEPFGIQRLGGDEVLPDLSAGGQTAAVLGVGKVRAGLHRVSLLDRLGEMGFALPVVVAPSAQIGSGSCLGPGTVVMDGVVIQPGCVVGRAGILNTGAVVDHDCVLGDDVHIGPSATLSGNVRVGDGCMIGVGAAVIQGVRISSGCTIGAGAAVVRDCTEPGVFVGVPARRIGE